MERQWRYLGSKRDGCSARMVVADPRRAVRAGVFPCRFARHPGLAADPDPVAPPDRVNAGHAWTEPLRLARQRFALPCGALCGNAETADGSFVIQTAVSGGDGER